VDNFCGKNGKCARNIGKSILFLCGKVKLDFVCCNKKYYINCLNDHKNNACKIMNIFVLEYNKHADIPRLYRRQVPLPNFSGGLNPPLEPHHYRELRVCPVFLFIFSILLIYPFFKQKQLIYKCHCFLHQLQLLLFLLNTLHQTLQPLLALHD